mmetsp:Transcript_85048/g.240836  ORF Transcript_85048/g.240836 Transcript_85048/m.240836 type:complete len:209 (-) Transcript_85048:18-644(-)
MDHHRVLGEDRLHQGCPLESAKPAQKLMRGGIILPREGDVIELARYLSQSRTDLKEGQDLLRHLLHLALLALLAGGLELVGDEAPRQHPDAKDRSDHQYAHAEGHHRHRRRQAPAKRSPAQALSPLRGAVQRVGVAELADLHHLRDVRGRAIPLPPSYLNNVLLARHALVLLEGARHCNLRETLGWQACAAGCVASCGLVCAAACLDP